MSSLIFQFADGGSFDEKMMKKNTSTIRSNLFEEHIQNSLILPSSKLCQTSNTLELLFIFTTTTTVS